ncbi:hypothetical protein [Alteromonas gracilis]|uniref:hypothetical protein n=1 Tax=Alteromonas gracilis TaxID=1479524 RepID=UPI0030D41431
MRTFWLIAVCLLSFYTSAKQVVYVPHEVASGTSEQPDDLGFRMFKALISGLDKQYQFVYEEASQARQWELLKASDNLCLYNKMRTEPRDRLANFTEFPLLTFPPNRLISSSPVIQGKEISIQSLLNNSTITIGIEEGRSYGRVLDAVITQSKDKFFVANGTSMNKRLYEMLERGRVNAIIEYTLSYNSLAAPYNLRDKYVYQIEGVDNYVDGYIACSNSLIGKALISKFDSLMRQEAYKQSASALIMRYVPDAERRQIINRLNLN